jgi:GNAT superfamily N-acetyltransferase
VRGVSRLWAQGGFHDRDGAVKSMHEQSVAVRQATILDLDLLVPLFDAYRQFYRKPSDLDLARRFLLERFQHNESVIFLAVRQDGGAAGFTQLFPSFSSASAARILILNDLFVLPDARRMRVGSLLLAAAAAFGRAVGAVRLTLSQRKLRMRPRKRYMKPRDGRGKQISMPTISLSLP